MTAPLLIKYHEGEHLTPAEWQVVQQVLAQCNVSINEAVALNIWSSDPKPLQEQLKQGNTYRYVSQTLDALATQLWYKTPDGEEVRHVLETLQNICYKDKSLAELYEVGRRLAMPGMTTLILSAMRKIHIAVNAENIIAHIYSAMYKNPIQDDIIVYRTIQEKAVGTSVTNCGFVSTSRTKEASFIKYPGYNTLFELTIPQSTHCIDITPFSNYDTVESEVLLPPNVITVTEQHTNGYATYIKGTVLEIEKLEQFW